MPFGVPHTRGSHGCGLCPWLFSAQTSGGCWLPAFVSSVRLDCIHVCSLMRGLALTLQGPRAEVERGGRPRDDLPGGAVTVSPPAPQEGPGLSMFSLPPAVRFPKVVSVAITKTPFVIPLLKPTETRFMTYTYWRRVYVFRKEWSVLFQSKKTI